MQNRELHESAGPQHARHLAEGALGVSHIHQADERGHGVKGRRAEGQGGAVTDQIADPTAVMASGRGDECFGGIRAAT
jgi:hypothetical protein